jgi:hypothetical protein
LAGVSARIAEVERQRTNLTRAIAALDDEEAAAPLLEQLSALSKRKKALVAERDALEVQRDRRAQSQSQLDELSRWCQTVAENLDTLDYGGKRMALAALNTTATVWRADHEPRYEIALSFPLDGDIVEGSSTPFSTAIARSTPNRSMG